MTTAHGIRCPRCNGTGKLPSKIAIADGTVYTDDPTNPVRCPDCTGSGTLDSGASPIWVWQGDGGSIWIAMHYGSLEISERFHDRAQAIEHVRIALRQEGLPAHGEVRDGTGHVV